MTSVRSLRGRLVFWLTVGATALWIVGALAASAVLQHELRESFDRAQVEAAQRLLPLVLDTMHDADVAAAAPQEYHLLPIDRDDALSYQLRRPDGSVAARSNDAPPQGFATPLAPGFSDTADFRVFTLEDADSKLSIQVAELLAHRQRALFGSALALFLPLLVLIPVSMLLIGFVVRRSLAPLEQLRTDIAARGSRNLTPVGADDLPDELVPIANALSELIGRVRTALEAERQFAANSAHELRTPIAGALAQVQRLIETSEDDRVRQEGRKIEATLRRLSDLAEKLLQLARADAGMAASGAPLAVLPVLELIVSDSRARLRPPRDIRLAVAPGASDYRAAINVDALGIVLRNLIDNALLHSAPDTPVEIEMAPDGRISVRNAAAVVPTDDIERLYGRFERGRTAANGAGLGLAIVQTIVRQVGGEFSVRSPIEGRTDGFEAVVRFA